MHGLDRLLFPSMKLGRPSGERVYLPGLRRARRAIGMSAEELARAAEIPAVKSTIYGWERGEQPAPVEVVPWLCRVLGCNREAITH